LWLLALNALLSLTPQDRDSKAKRMHQELVAAASRGFAREVSNSATEYASVLGDNIAAVVDTRRMVERCLAQVKELKVRV
jgi:hypothetical protein